MINHRIKQILSELGLSSRQLAAWLNVSDGRISQKFKEGVWDSLEELKLISANSGYSLDWIVTGKGHKHFMEKELGPPSAEEPTPDYLHGKKIRPITVTVDRSGKELITYVPVKAQAGYARGYSDDKFIEKLPAFSLPNFQDHGTFRMFQVSGDSMRQLGGGGLQDGDVVIAQYVEDFYTMKDNMVYVIVSTDGIVIKRVINRLSTTDKMLVLKSDNKNGDYPNVILQANKLVEVWEYKAHISRQLNFATDLFEMINEIQVQQAKLSQRVDEMDSKTMAIIKGK